MMALHNSLVDDALDGDSIYNQREQVKACIELERMEQAIRQADRNLNGEGIHLKLSQLQEILEELKEEVSSIYGNGLLISA